MEKLRKELEKKNKEAQEEWVKKNSNQEAPNPTSTAQERATDVVPSSQGREEYSSLVGTVTKDNIHQVSRLHKGMLRNPNGTLTRTPQYETWCRDNEVQLKDLYETPPHMDEESATIPYHPKPSRKKTKMDP